MNTVKKRFKTLAALNKFISETSLPGAEVIPGELLVKYQVKEEEEVTGCVGCALPVEPKEETPTKEEVPAEILAARDAFKESEGKEVPSNKKNDVEWMNSKVEGK